MPQVRTCFAWSLHQLMPEMRAALCIAIRTFFLHPHCSGQNQIRRYSCHCGVGIRDHNKVIWIAITRVALFHHIGGCLHIVGHHDPVRIELAVLEHAVLLHCMVARLIRNSALWQLPYLLGNFSVLGIGYDHVRWQTMRKSSYFSRRSACRWLACERKRTVARRRNFSCQQVNVVDHIVGPDTTCMLVKPHGPERHNLALWISVQLRQFFESIGRHSRQLGGVLQGIG